MHVIESLLNKLPDSMMMALVLFVFLYLIYLCLATIAYLFLRSKYGLMKLVLLPLTATAFVVYQLFAGIVEAFNSPLTNENASKKQKSIHIKMEDNTHDHVIKTPDFNRAASDPNYATKHGLGGYNDTFWE